MTPPRLAAELAISPKSLRAFLRRRFPRDAIDHGTAWFLTPAQIAMAREHFNQQKSPALAAAILHPGHLLAPTQAPTKAVMASFPLRCYVQPALDVLFVALNPPTQSANNGHWFSGSQSAFFTLLFKSGLITATVDKRNADEIVFGGTSVNYKGARFGVTDLRPDHVETDSANVKVSDECVNEFIRTVRVAQPRIVCMIHSKVWNAFNDFVGRSPELVERVRIGRFTQPLRACSSQFICNYFPNGNGIPDHVKIDVFATIRNSI